ncbi:unnamed protein product, partial [Allacma fusca]
MFTAASKFPITPLKSFKK